MEKIKSALERARNTRARETVQGSVKQRNKLASNKIGVSSEIIKYTKTKIINVDSSILKKKGIIKIEDNSIEANAYKVLRTRVLQSMRTNTWSTLGVTSPTAGNGKTLTAINLAISLSKEVNQTVLLVDLDLRKPNIHKSFSITGHPGISQYISGGIELCSILINPGLDRLVILPGKDPIQNSSEMLSSPKMIKLVEELKTYYPGRIIIFDLPPILSSDDVLAFVPYIDCLMLVVEDGKTDKNDLNRSLQLVSKDKLIGTVLNKSNDKSIQSYY